MLNRADSRVVLGVALGIDINNATQQRMTIEWRLSDSVVAMDEEKNIKLTGPI